MKRKEKLLLRTTLIIAGNLLAGGVLAYAVFVVLAMVNWKP